MTTKINIQKLDNRHSGNNHYSHRIVLVDAYRANALNKYAEVRKWCWDTYGPGHERDLGQPENGWGWYFHPDTCVCYIYLTPEKLTHFSLKWT